jgi:hypothetical protein
MVTVGIVKEPIMDIGNVASMSSALSQAKNSDAVSLSVLKKTMNIEAQTAAQLLQALPPPVASNPPNLGNSIDILA